MSQDLKSIQICVNSVWVYSTLIKEPVLNSNISLSSIIHQRDCNAGRSKCCLMALVIIVFIEGVYLSVLLGRLDHVHVHIIHHVGHLRHVLDNLVRLSRSISLGEGNKKDQSEKEYLESRLWCERNVMKPYVCLVSRLRLGNDLSDANGQGNYNPPARYRLLIWKQMSHLLPQAIAAHAPSKGGCRVLIWQY